MARLDYIFSSNQRAISLNPINSDSVVNLAHMEQLVGTLVKQEPTGRYAPYLSQSWQTSEDFKSWRFKMRQGLKCENGETISAESFRKSFVRNLRAYAANPVPVFEDLIGFEEFVAGDDLSGIKVENDQITFNFVHPVKTGVVEFLGMPYFGYYCDANYNADGSWKSESTIVSSGPYSLKSIADDRFAIELHSRKDWFSISDHSPSDVSIRQLPIAAAFAYPSAAKIIFGYNEPDLKVPADVIEVKSVPEILVALVLSPYIKNLFHLQSNREVFYDRWLTAKTKIEFPDQQNDLTDFFYANAHSPLKVRVSKTSFSRPAQPTLSVLVSDHLHAVHRKYIEDALKFIFADVPIKLVLRNVDRKDPHWMAKYTSNREADIRVAGVSTGGSFQNWVVKMMFCSKLGVSFPDPSKRVCKLVSDFDSTGLSAEEFLQNFNQILYEDGSVIPFFHRRYSWFVTANVDYTLSPVTGAPRFDLMKLK